MLNSFHVPLVDEHNDFVTLRIVDLAEKLLVFLVDTYFLELGEEDVSGLDEPVHVGGIEALFGEGLGADHAQLLPVADHLVRPARLQVLESLDDILWHIKAGLVVQALPASLV